jgi:hypothetical protein
MSRKHHPFKAQLHICEAVGDHGLLQLLLGGWGVEDWVVVIHPHQHQHLQQV